MGKQRRWGGAHPASAETVATGMGINRRRMLQAARSSLQATRRLPNPHLTPTELAWLAGLVEGEGCFSKTSQNGKPSLYIGMTDSDVIERAARILCTHIYTKRRRPPYQTLYVIRVTGTYAVGWMFTLYPYLGLRRRERIRELLSMWKAQGLGKGQRTRIWGRAAS